MDCRRRRTSNTYRSDRAIYDQLSSSRRSFSYSLNGFRPAVSLLSGLLYQVDITPRPSELCECVFYPPEEALSDHTAYQQDPLPPSCEVYSSSAGSLNFSMRHTTKRYLAIGVVSPAREVCMTRRRIRGVSLLGAHGPSPWQDSEVSSCLTRHSGPLALLVLVVTNQPTGWYYHTIMLYLNLNAFRMNGHSRKVYMCRGGYPVPQAHRIMHFMAQFNIYISVRSLPYLPALVARARGHGIQPIPSTLRVQSFGVGGRSADRQRVKNVTCTFIFILHGCWPVLFLPLVRRSVRSTALELSGRQP
ncbi:hypothetical protein B0H14DRAFT_3158110 [Mycena olivaceomarginata]|nr:hypothetical protein B0H14DRAFT_3158110 [Mycena olivaceomarginata]